MPVNIIEFAYSGPLVLILNQSTAQDASLEFEKIEYEISLFHSKMQ